MVFSELYDRKRALLKEDQLLFVVGKVRYDEFAQRLSISADELMDLTEARAKSAARLRIEVDGAGDVARLRDALSPYRARTVTAERVAALSSTTAMARVASTFHCPRTGACGPKIGWSPSSSRSRG